MGAMSDGEWRLTAARKLHQDAARLLREKSGPSRKAAEQKMRESLQLLLEALLHAPSDALRRSLHEVGRRTRLLFGCTVPFRDGHYSVSCPVHFSHLDDLAPYAFTRDEVLAQLSGEERARFVYGETALTCDHCLGCPDGQLGGTGVARTAERGPDARSGLGGA
jgi:hypothetical protein